MDHDGGGLGGCEKVRRQGRLRRGRRVVEGSRSIGKSIDISGDQRKRSLESARNSLASLLMAKRIRMTIRRREFIALAGAAALSPALPRSARAADNVSVYDFERFGNARILHITDTHAQRWPAYFLEPSVTRGIGPMAGQPPHLA